MARLNYTSRKISGVKAGSAVKKDLTKRIPTSTNFKVRDPLIEIDVSDKDLTDDGFNEFIVELVLALQSTSPEFPRGVNKLQELHLRGNKLSVNVLFDLAKVIHLASNDLKELDISYNDIRIASVADLQKWKFFLQSFSQCCVLKKVDFSGNDLGTLGMEMLARIYIRSELDFLQDIIDSGEESSDGLQEREMASELEQTRNASTRKVNPSKHHIYSDTELKHYACTRGLRSVPYIVLQNVSMSNAGIVHVAEMVKMHRNPENLLSYLPPGKVSALPPLEPGSSGIIWQPNHGISELSLRLMKLVEQCRHFTEDSSSETELVNIFEDLNMDGLNFEEAERALEETERHRRERQKLTVQLGRVTRQQRIFTLATEGLRHAIIWHCGLQMLAMARAILLEYTHRPPSVEEEVKAAKKARSSPFSPRPPVLSPMVERNLATQAVYGRKSLPARMLNQAEPFNPTAAVILRTTPRRLDLFRDCVPQPPVVSTAPQVDRQPDLPIPSLTTRSIAGELESHWPAPERKDTPRGALISSMHLQPGSSKFGFLFPAMHHPSENPLADVNPPAVAAAMPNYPFKPKSDTDSDHEARVKGQIGQIPAHLSPHSTPIRGGKSRVESETYRSKYRFGLPLHLWQRIIATALGANSILHPDQQSKIVSYAASWDALEVEMSISGAAQHQQIWKILDNIDCFTYKPLS